MTPSDYPTLNAPSADCGVAVLTPAMLDNFRDRLLDPKRRERAQRDRERQEATLNQLTKEDMAKLNEACFNGWLKYKGVTEQEFWDWLG